MGRYLVVLLVLLAGCGGSPAIETTETTVVTDSAVATTQTDVPETDGTEPGAATRLTTDAPNTSQERYIISTAVVDEPPADANVTAYNSTLLRDVSYVRDVLERTVEGGGLFENVDRERYDQLSSELADVPRFDGGDFGYYFAYRGKYVQLRTLVEE